MNGEVTTIAPPGVCGHADVEFAHEQMRTHRNCRIERCVWKAAAYHTLVAAGRLVPQSLSPRMRAAVRGIAFPARDHEPPAAGGPTSSTLREVLDRLSELALPVASRDDGGFRPGARRNNGNQPRRNDADQARRNDEDQAFRDDRNPAHRNDASQTHQNDEDQAFRDDANRAWRNDGNRAWWNDGGPACRDDAGAWRNDGGGWRR